LTGSSSSRPRCPPGVMIYVQANLLVNRTGSMPVLYHLA
jgi:hypothetical protein